jgi:hypothetical protein
LGLAAGEGRRVGRHSRDALTACTLVPGLDSPEEIRTFVRQPASNGSTKPGS